MKCNDLCNDLDIVHRHFQSKNCLSEIMELISRGSDKINNLKKKYEEEVEQEQEQDQQFIQIEKR